MKIPVFFSRASIPVLVFRLENPIYKKIAFLSFLTSVLAAQAISAAANGVIYKVRLENGAGEKKNGEVPKRNLRISLNIAAGGTGFLRHSSRIEHNSEGFLL